jgi:hypothetical protein
MILASGKLIILRGSDQVNLNTTTFRKTMAIQRLPAGVILISS